MMFLTLLASLLLLCTGGSGWFFQGTGWPDKGCGQSAVYRRQRYIIGGRPALDGEFPWMVSLAVENQENVTECGGSLIKQNIVLTAAHCIRGFVRGYVAAGYLDKNKPGRHYQRRIIDKYVCYEANCENRHDIALIKLVSPFNFWQIKRRIGTVCLHQKNRALGKIVTITGWGRTSLEEGSGSSRLLAITVPVIEENICKRLYPRFFIPKMTFCAGILGKTTAKGDSGGPAVERMGRKSVQVGIVARVYTKESPVPGALVKVSAYSDWIADRLKVLQ